MVNSRQSHLDVRTTVEHLENIRIVLNLPIATLASVFGVSRQAIYKWLAQVSSPEPNKVESIIKLSKIADAFKQAGIHRTGALLHMKLFNGESLLDLLKTGKSNENHSNQLLAEAQIMETSYQRSGLAQSNAPSTNDWLSSVSIPAYHEEN